MNIKFKTHNQESEIDAGGTSLIGAIDTDYATLKRIFGEPTDSDGYKVDAEWIIKFSDGKVATIYNYKSGRNYLGRSGTPKTKIRDWHIGGIHPIVVKRVVEIIKFHGGEVRIC